MTKKFINREKFLIMICGLPGTGKTVIAQKLADRLAQYILINQNVIRRQMGVKRMPKNQEMVLRKIDRLTAEHLRNNRGVIFDSVNRHSFRRHQMYGVASCCGKRVITLEIICSEETAKKRIRGRPKSDGLLSDPRDPAVYDKLKILWENVEIDFKYPGEDHVTYLQFDTEINQLWKVIPRKGTSTMVRQIKAVLRT